MLSWSDFVRRDERGAVVMDSRTMERRPAPGEALWIKPLVPHSVENIGAADLHLIAVDVKTGRAQDS